MALEPINYGAAANDGTGDSLRDAMHKAQGNFEYLQTELAKKSNVLDGAAFVSMNNLQEPSLGGLRVYQAVDSPALMPDAQWWSLIRTQHPGYPLGYWQDFALPFAAGRPRVRSNTAGTFSPWKELAYRSDTEGLEPASPISDDSRYWRGDKTWQVLNKTVVGLSRVDNTSDSEKPVSQATQTQLDARVKRDGCDFVGFLPGGVTPYLQRTADGAKHTLAVTNGGGQVFSGRVTGNKGFVSITGVDNPYGFLAYGQGGNYGVYKYITALWAGELDGHSMTAYLQPNVESFWQFVVGGGTFRMLNSGTGTSAGGWSATSDNRVKYQVRKIESALDKVDQLNGYTYIRQDMADISGNMPVRSGVIAQEVLKVLPSTVNVPANYDPVNNRGDLLSVSLDGLVGLLINAVKELRQEVETLKLER